MDSGLPNDEKIARFVDRSRLPYGAIEGGCAGSPVGLTHSWIGSRNLAPSSPADPIILSRPKRRNFKGRSSISVPPRIMKMPLKRVC